MKKINNNASKNRRIFLIAFISLVLLILILTLSLLVGAQKLDFFKDNQTKNLSRIILIKLRMPRSLIVLLSGILLGGTGAVFQLFFRNPLAEPGIMGISAGATLGAVAGECLGLGTVFSGIFKFIAPINMFAFAGAVLSGILVTILAGGRFGKKSSVMILLCGTALGTLYSAMSSIIMLLSNKELRSIFSWMMGSFNGRGWNEFIFMLFPSFISILLMCFMANSLDLLGGGENTARTLGLNVGRLRAGVLLCGAFGISAAVCGGGTISFAGLISPHIARKLIDPKARILIPFSMIFGGILLLLADTVARVVILPGELPAGIITSILGVPFFISLVLAEKN